MTTLMQWARHHLPRLGTALHQRCLAPVLAVLRWEGVILLAGIGLASLGALATRWLFVFGLIAALLLGLAWGRALAPGARGQSSWLAWAPGTRAKMRSGPGARRAAKKIGARAQVL